MVQLLPFTFLISFASLFGLAWIIVGVDPQKATWYIFALFVFLLFAFLFCLLGLAFYFIRTKFYRRYSSNWYVYTSFKMAFFLAFFMAIVAILALGRLISLFNIVLTIVAVSLFAFWSYLGKKVKVGGKG